MPDNHSNFFISHSEKDAQFLEQLRRDLLPYGISLWMAEKELKPGDPDWDDTIREAIKASPLVLLIASPNSRRSRYVGGELEIAEMFGRTIIPLWAHGEQWGDAVRIGLVSAQRIDLREGHYQNGLQDLIALLGETGERLEPGQPPEPNFEPRNPYKGLRSFTAADAGDFFGRERLVTEMLDMVSATLSPPDAQTPAERFLAVVGPSGSGKSSVVMAGLLPQLQRGAKPRSEGWTYLTPMRPGSDPVNTLATILWEKLADKSVRAIREDLADPAADGLQLLAPLMVQHTASKVVLVIDQFEELFAQVTDERERRQFIDLIAGAVTAPNGPLIVVVTLRADFYSALTQYPQLISLVERHQKIVPPMDTEDYRRAIEGPAALPDVRVQFDRDLVGDLLFETRGQPGALPLLQFTLDQLFQRRQGHLLTREAYDKIGGVKGALVNHAEEAYNHLPAEDQPSARMLFLRLTDPGMSEQEATRRSVSLQELTLRSPDETRRLRATADAFIQARLLTRDERAGVTTTEVSHEALLREWPRLKEWLHDAREDVLFQQRLAGVIADWNSHGRPTDRLYHGSQLADALDWAQRYQPNAAEQTFIDASVTERERLAVVARQQELLELRRSKQQARRYGFLSAALTAVLIIAIAASGVAISNSNLAQMSERAAQNNLVTARAQALAGDANLALTSNGPDQASLLAVVATLQHDSYETRNALLNAVQSTNYVETILREAGATPGQAAPDQSGQSKFFLDGANSMAVSLDGSTLASFSATQHIVVWNRSNMHKPRVILDASKYHKNAIFALALSPDGKYLVSTGYDGIWLWDTTKGSVQQIDANSTFFAATFSRSGTQLRLAAAKCIQGANFCDNSHIEIWDVGANGTLSAAPHMLSTQGETYSLDFSPDGHWLASSGCVYPDCTNATQLWNLDNMNAVPLASVDPIVGGGVAFSPDGKWLASSGCVGNCSGLMTKIWPMSHAGPGTPYDYPNIAGQLGFITQQGSDTLVVSGCGNDLDFASRPVCTDTTFDDVDVQSHHVDVSGQSVTGYVTRLAVFADTGEMAVGISNGDIILLSSRDLTSNSAALSGSVPQNSDNASTAVLLRTYGAFSPQGTLALAGGGTLLTWTANNGKTDGSPISLGDTVQSGLAYSPDGRTLAVGSGASGTITLLDTSGHNKGTLTWGSSRPVMSIAFSPDGKTLVASVCADDSCTGTSVLQWDVTQTNPKPKTLDIPSTLFAQSLAYDPAQPAVLAIGRLRGKVTLWNTQTNTAMDLPQVLLGPIVSLAFSPDGRTLATVVLFKDITTQPTTYIQYWDMDARAPLGQGFDYRATIFGAAFSADGKQFELAAYDPNSNTDQVLRYSYSPEAWRYRACAVANRPFSDDEMALYQVDQKYRNVCATVADPK